MSNHIQGLPIYAKAPGSGLHVASIVIFAICGLLALVFMAFSLGPVNFVIAAAVALIPLPVYLGLVLVIDRFHPEPPGKLVWAFLAGASVVILLALLANTVIGLLNYALFGASLGDILTASTVAPVVEETLKGAVLCFMVWRERHRFNGVIDGVVYASMVGLGFATVENIQYYGMGLAEAGVFVPTVILRGIFSPFAHPVFTAMTGIALAIAASRTDVWRWLAPPIGLIGAITLHGLWNASASIAGGIGFLALFVLLMVPCFVTVVIVAITDTSRERRLVRHHLQFEVQRGLLSPFDVDALTSIGKRRALIGAARRLHPEAGRFAHELATAARELAFTRERITNGTFSSQYGEPRARANELAQYVVWLRTQLPPPPEHAPWTGLAGALNTLPYYAYQPQPLPYASQ